MEFAIQCSNPRSIEIEDASGLSASEILEEIIPLYSENCIFIWNDVYIPLSYKYDISIMLDDIFLLLEAMTTNESDSICIAWPSNTFSSDWNISWDHNTVKITANWECVIGNTETTLNEKNAITINKDDFLSEWKMLPIIISDLVWNKNHHHKNDEFYRIDELIKKINQPGLFYRD